MITSRFERISALTGIAAIALWVGGILVMSAVPSDLPDGATDPQTLAWVKHNSNALLAGGWLFILGSLCFIWFVGALRSRLVVAEGGAGTVSTIAFTGGVATALFGALIPSGDLALAINKDEVSAATAGALHHMSDAFFVTAELALVVLLVGVAVLGFRTRVVPRWFAAFGVLLSVVLVIGPIGWAGLIFGLPVWTLTATILIVRPRRAAGRAPGSVVTA
jgi:hypothetical protein